MYPESVSKYRFTNYSLPIIEWNSIGTLRTLKTKRITICSIFTYQLSKPIFQRLKYTSKQTQPHGLWTFWFCFVRYSASCTSKQTYLGTHPGTNSNSFSSTFFLSYVRCAQYTWHTLASLSAILHERRICTQLLHASVFLRRLSIRK